MQIKSNYSQYARKHSLPRRAKYAAATLVSCAAAIYYQLLFRTYSINFAWEVWKAFWTLVVLSIAPLVGYFVIIYILRKIYEIESE